MAGKGDMEKERREGRRKERERREEKGRRRKKEEKEILITINVGLPVEHPIGELIVQLSSGQDDAIGTFPSSFH